MGILLGLLALFFMSADINHYFYIQRDLLAKLMMKSRDLFQFQDQFFSGSKVICYNKGFTQATQEFLNETKVIKERSEKEHPEDHGGHEKNKNNPPQAWPRGRSRRSWLPR